MFGVVLVLSLLFLQSSPQNYDMECLWCINVVYSAQDYFGDDIVNATNQQLDDYFNQECRLDRIKSPLLSAVCYEMFQNHQDALFKDLRQNASALQTCLDCGFCETS
ncbi:hypothetical protein Y032_0096g2935 [Ancylostoma ceylanicum]|uniref:Saposin B-type domain-containing protein n=1 Tax=Ancylostoma ceylanicum TaxID=53326 RepID=A0A016TK66_9BILA|nr:hypothetical protein Y032_0096g2935 [Ancylostoma ceylanicum]